MDDASAAADSDRPHRFTVTENDDGVRLDRFLTERLPDRTRSSLRRLIVQGLVRVDGDTAPKTGFRLEVGTLVELCLPADGPDRPVAESIALEVVHEDDHLLVVNKPAGLVVHPGHGHRRGTLVNALLGRGTPLAPSGAPDRPGIVHRLDQGTSGLLVVAKNDCAHRALSDAFARRDVGKRYVALVWGRPKPSDGRVERKIARSRIDRLKMTVSAGRGRPALTDYRTLEDLPGFALLELRPETGRTHQIRVHLQSIHHPVVGDARYGGRPWRGLQDPLKRKAVREFDRLALHAASLRFDHPATGQPIRLQAPLPEEFVSLLAVLRRN